MTMRRSRPFLAGLSALAVWAASAAPVAAAPAPPPAGLVAQLSYPFLNGLVADRAGDRIAWIAVNQGKRAVWTAAAPGFRPRQVFSTGVDDGQELTGLTLSPDGATLAWVRGGDHDANWPADGNLQPDPGSSGHPPELEVWRAPAAGGAAVKVGNGDAPALAATGRIAFVRDGAVWGAAPGATPERLFYDRGKASGLHWSPDGQRLAFVSDRGDHAFIGIYSGKDQPIRWLAPSSGHDDLPVWSPDGRQVAFIRQPGDGGAPEPLLSESFHPWAIWVADAGSGEGHPAWTASHTMDASYPEVPGGPFLAWAAGDRLLFRAEMDGWPHLYAVAATGGAAPVLLTSGAFMVDRPSLSPDGRSVLFDANTGNQPGDDDRRHLFRVGVDRPGAVALTRGDGLETMPQAVTGGVAFVSATPQRPAALFLAGRDGQDPHPIGDTVPYPAERLVVPRAVTWRAPDGLLVHGQLFAAPGGGIAKSGIVFVHGGPPRQMLLGWSYMDYYANAYAMNQYLAAHGYVVLAINYRLGIGYGRAFQHPAHAGAAGSSEYQDVLAGGRFLAAQPGVDAHRIGIWGGSYGGLLTALALARDSDLFKAGVDFHGVHDWSRALGEEVHPPKRYEQGDWDQALKVAFNSSPVAAVAGWHSPVLFIHGDDDRNVRFNQTIDLERRLDALGRPYEELVFPDEIHGLLRWADWLAADSATIRFFDRTLKP